MYTNYNFKKGKKEQLTVKISLGLNLSQPIHLYKQSTNKNNNWYLQRGPGQPSRQAAQHVVEADVTNAQKQ